MNRIRRESLALSGGRTPGLRLPLAGRCDDFPREAYVRGKTNQKVAEAIVPAKTPARDAAGPPIDINLTQLTSDAQGHVDTTEWMHGWWGHSCGCSENT